jgi:hypothetical protein
VRARLHAGGSRAGGVVRYPHDQLLEEVAFVAYHFHWPQTEVLGLEHEDRRRWVAEISKINRQMNESVVAAQDV